MVEAGKKRRRGIGDETKLSVDISRETQEFNSLTLVFPIFLLQFAHTDFVGTSIYSELEEKG